MGLNANRRCRPPFVKEIKTLRRSLYNSYSPRFVRLFVIYRDWFKIFGKPCIEDLYSFELTNPVANNYKRYGTRCWTPTHPEPKSAFRTLIKYNCIYFSK